MCGIVGVVGNNKALSIVVEGLSRLEYRGYDSAGVAVQTTAGEIHSRKAVGKLANLRGVLDKTPMPDAQAALGHTRWATHGSPTDANTHPHVGQFKDGPAFTVVHNGIIENYQDLRATLTHAGAIFISETDTETVPFALAHALGENNPTPDVLLETLRTVTGMFRGNYALGIMVEGQPDILLATRRGAPLCIALGEGWNGLASDPLAFAGVTERFIFLADNDCALLTPQGVTIIDANGSSVKHPIQRLDLSADMSGKQGFAHFMLKEIHEQPAVIARLVSTYTTPNGTLKLPFTLPAAPLSFLNIVACGTAYYAGCVGKYMLEETMGIPVNVDVASEFRYRKPPLVAGGVFVAISQSGETADTLAALEYAKSKGQFVIAITNTPTSSIARAADAVMDLHAGREVAVASTKAFMAMMVSLALLGLSAASKAEQAARIAELRSLPNIITRLLADVAPIARIAETLTRATSMLYLGRGVLAPLAYEGALKMKEISYIHAEGYASGEMKHGPIALVDNTLPVIHLASGHDGLFEKTLSNLHEVKARHGRVILLTDNAGANQLDTATRAHITLLEIPDAPRALAPFVFIVPLQLLAYTTATAKGTDVDQPRNLAKSVTVE